MRPSAKELLRSADLPAFLVNDPLHLSYVADAPIDHGFLLIQKSGVVLFANELFLPDVAAIRKRKIAIHPMADLAGFLKKISRCGIESERMTVETLARLKAKHKGVKFIPKIGIIEEFRRTKDTEELRNIRIACRITKNILREIPSLLKSSITERHLADQIEIRALQLGANSLAFPSIVAFGSHSASLHHLPTSRAMKSGHIVQIDIGVKVNGYCSDMSEVFFTAAPSKEERHILQTVRRAKAAAMKAVKPGASTQELDRIARAVLRKEGLEDAFCHSLGHGVGLEVHEGVHLSKKAADDRLRKHEVITIEPGLYFPGKFGMRLEETIIVL